LKKEDSSLKELIKYYEIREIPVMPVNADLLINKYEIPKGKQLGEKLTLIEEVWVQNNFKISNQEVDSIVKN
jgi:poly(A) polymerase